MGYSPWDCEELHMTEATEHACMYALLTIITTLCFRSTGECDLESSFTTANFLLRQ